MTQLLKQKAIPWLNVVCSGYNYSSRSRKMHLHRFSAKWRPFDSHIGVVNKIDFLIQYVTGDWWATLLVQNLHMFRNNMLDFRWLDFCCDILVQFILTHFQSGPSKVNPGYWRQLHCSEITACALYGLIPIFCSFISQFWSGSYFEFQLPVNR